MNRIALGAVSALLLAGAGFFWWQGRAEVERGAPPPDLSGAMPRRLWNCPAPIAWARARSA
jgi:hypothetical protein